MKKEFGKDEALACRKIISASVNIQRINSYDDVRFSKKVLLQHGAYLMEDVPYYEIQWNQYCDLVFGQETDSLEKTE